ncbi:hypothetical protein PTKIN_Ptkin14bG0207900 [Pterospermum kingtungense]
MAMMKHQQDNLKNNNNNNNLNLLLRRAHGNTIDDIPDQKYVGFHYFSLLSAEIFSVIENICFPFYKIGHVCNSPHVVGTCNGLLCLKFIDESYPEEANDVLSYRFFGSHINGFYYCIAFHRNRIPSILSFDFVNEKFSTLPLPDIFGSLDHHYELELLDFNRLLVVFVYRKGTEKSFEFVGYE